MLGRFAIIPALAAALSIGGLGAAGPALGPLRMPHLGLAFGGARSVGSRRSGWTNASYRRAAAKKRRVKAARKAARGRR